METNKVYFWEPYFKGIGQIMLQDNAVTGMLFFLGIFVGSPVMALAALVGAFVGTMTAKLLKYDEAEINMGLYGFNATLVGVGLIANFEATIVIWVAIVVMSAISTIAMNFCLRKKVPIFTFPFIVLVWISLYIFHSLVPVPPHVEEAELIESTFTLTGFGFGFDQVIFQASLISGAIFFLAVFISSPISALYGLFGSILGITLAILFKERLGDVKMGMFSFNSVLCAITFSGNKKTDGIYVVIAVLLSGITEDIMLRNGWAVLTFPFVFATWLTLIVRDVLVKKFITPANG